MLNKLFNIQTLLTFLKLSFYFNNHKNELKILLSDNKTKKSFFKKLSKYKQHLVRRKARQIKLKAILLLKYYSKLRFKASFIKYNIRSKDDTKSQKYIRLTLQQRRCARRFGFFFRFVRRNFDLLIFYNHLHRQKIFKKKDYQKIKKQDVKPLLNKI